MAWDFCREKAEGTGKLLSKDLWELCTELLYLAVQGDPWVKGTDVRCAELHPITGVHGGMAIGPERGTWQREAPTHEAEITKFDLAAFCLLSGGKRGQGHRAG